MSRKKKISRVSETRVKEWAEKNDASVNSSDPDEFGWDHYIEFETTPIQESLHGLHKSPLKCKAQIKATDVEKGNRQLTLSSLKHVATDAIPAFIIFIEYYRKDKPKKLYVTHIDEEISYQILSRCAKAKSKGRKLNKSKYTIPDKHRKEIQKPFGKNLIHHMKECIGHSMEKYQSSKMEYLSALGFEGGKIETTFTLPNVKEAVLQSLHGNEEFIRVDKFSHTIRRFGVEEAPDELNKGQLWLNIISRDKPKKGKLTIEGSEGFGEIEFEVKFITAKINHFLPIEKRTVLIEGKCFDITLENSESHSEFSITEKNNSQVQIQEIAKYYRLVSYLLDTKKKRTIKMTTDGKEGEIEITGKYDLGSDGTETSFEVMEQISVLDKILEACATEVSFSDLRVTLQEFQQVFSTAKLIFEMYETIAKKVQGDKLSTTLAKNEKRAKKYCILITLICPIGDHLFVCVMSVSSTNIEKYDSNGITLNHCQVQVHLKDLSHKNKVNTMYRSKINDISIQAIESKSKQGYTVIVPMTLE